MTDYVLPLSSPQVSLASAGGKGTNLAALAQAGFPVPPAFLVTTEAYRNFVRANGIQATILELAGAVRPEHSNELEEASERIRALFENGKIPDEIVQAILAAYISLTASPPGSKAREQGQPGPEKAPAVAVRSSATAEDLPGLSFAGQQESYLNVTGPAPVLDAVKSCWSSLWTARAIGYRARNQVSHEDSELAVVVQRMVSAEVSGVMFTANPLTGRRDEITIDASFGLGEAVVSGQVEPDSYRVNASEWSIVERKLGAKGMAVVPRSGGGTEQMTREAGEEQALSDDVILELAKLGARVASHFGSPQDIEWAWAEGQPYLLQSRPITTLYPLPVTRRPDHLRVYASVNAVQGVNDPFTPLGLDALRLLLGGVPRVFHVQRPIQQLMPTAAGRLLLDVTDLARDPILRNLLMALLARADPAARQALVRILAAGRLAPNRSLSMRRFVQITPVIARMLGRAAVSLWSPGRARASGVRELNRLLGGLQRREAAAPNLLARLTTMEEEFGQVAGTVIQTMMPSIALSLALLSMIDRRLHEWLGTPPGAALPLMRGLPGNVTTEMDLELWGAAQAIRADEAARAAVRTQAVDDLAEDYREGRLPPVAQGALEQFMARYGMRAVAEIDLGRPRWRDDPTPILQSLKGYLQMEDPDTAPDLIFRKGAADAGRLAGEYVALVRETRFGALRAYWLRWAIRRMRALGAIRELPKLYLVRTLDLFRTALLESGREMATRGELEQPEDIFFVPTEVLRRAALGERVDLKKEVQAQRVKYEQERHRRQTPHLLLSTGETFYQGMEEDGKADLVGDPVSPGLVEGQVRVVLDPRGTRLEPGEILVCPATDPGWTPLFLTAGGLVMEMGGLATHGSVVAREYGIPAVVGVDQATTRLRTGQRVRVDGNLGRVVVLDEVESPPIEATAVEDEEARG